ncbi:aldo/keto reductase [Streptomyces venezuelae]|uniref:Aldo/keto reductase n=1 Tax=Streptomyces venezuelae TaxID=54571 RepID=A0A5P2D0L5_STRVZ|nr:aldo/keto reductase [Streptomyces venezuelae]QES46649.1 aldo/keto reductase [Streptomyces venezuelae]
MSAERSIGTVRVSAVGLGAMPLSVEGRPDRDRALATLHAALDAGVTLLDTADSYHWHTGETGHNELLVARALAGRGPDRDSVLVATKGGRGRPGDGSWTVDARPEHLRLACEASLRRLGTEAIGLYQLHKPDPDVPWAESVGTLRELAEEGKIRAAGISNVSVEQLDQAREILGDLLVSVQNRYSPAVRDSEPQLRRCAELGLAFLPWSPLGGISRSSLDGPSGPTSSGTAFHRVAAEHEVSPQRVCLAWLLSRAPVVIPIPGATRPRTARDSAAAPGLTLTPAQLGRLDAAVAAWPPDS